MWKKIYDVGKWLLSFGQQTTKNQKDIEALEEKVNKLTNALHHMYLEMQQMRSEMQSMKETERLERENLLLRHENEMLKFERRLPPPKSEDEE